MECLASQDAPAIVANVIGFTEWHYNELNKAIRTLSTPAEPLKKKFHSASEISPACLIMSPQSMKEKTNLCCSNKPLQETACSQVHRCLQFAVHSPGHIGVNWGSGVFEQYVEPSLQIWSFLTLFYTHIKQLVEVLEGVLVHWIYFSQSGYHKVHNRASSGHWTILLTSSRYLLLCLLCFSQTLRNLTWRDL